MAYYFSLYNKIEKPKMSSSFPIVLIRNLIRPFIML